MLNRKRIVVFASGTGTNFINIYNKIKDGDINGKIVLLISNNKFSNALKFAKNNNIDCQIINIQNCRTEEEICRKYRTALEKYYPDLILLAGFMKKIPISVIRKYKNKILNIHPSLLPKYGGKGYYGIKVHRAVLESNEKETGATVHFVDEHYDTGPILLQEKIVVSSSETPEILAKRVLELEYLIYYKAVRLFCEGRVLIKNNTVEIK